MDHRALGKGLSALIPEKPIVSDGAGEGVFYVGLGDVRVNVDQPRKNYDQGKLDELIASIKENGLLQPILVRRIDNGYEVIAGERRFRAAKALKLQQVPVIIKEVSTQESFVLALIENIQREELSAIEEGLAYKRLIEEFNFTQDKVAQSVSKDRSTVSNTLRLLRLPKDIQDAVLSGAISMGHARALLSIEDPAKQKQVFIELLAEKISVRDLESVVQREVRPKRNSAATEKRSGDFLFWEEHLQKIIGTKVRINSKKKRGKIVIEFYSPNDLDRILKLFQSEASL